MRLVRYRKANAGSRKEIQINKPSSVNFPEQGVVGGARDLSDNSLRLGECVKKRLSLNPRRVSRFILMGYSPGTNNIHHHPSGQSREFSEFSACVRIELRSIYVLLFFVCVRDNTSSLLSDSLSVSFRRWLNEKMEKQCVEVIYGELLDASVGYSILAICFFIENLSRS